MYKQVILFLFCLLLAASLLSCDNTTPATEDTTNTSTSDTIKETPPPATTPATDRGNFFSAEEQTTLRKRIDQSLINKLSDAIYSLNDALTDQQMEAAFLQSTTTLTEIEEAIFKLNIDGSEMANEWNFLDSVTTVYYASCVAECTEFRFEYNIKQLQELATNTTGNADDSFFALALMAEGEIGGREGAWYNFFARTWDYGGGSLLGDSLCYQFLNQSWKHLQTSNLFKPSVEMIRKACIRDMGHPIYMSESTAILKEINQILTADILAAAEIAQIQKIKTAITAGKIEKTIIQFGCKDPNKNCDWGG
jgi:hypothetical protein